MAPVRRAGIRTEDRKREVCPKMIEGREGLEGWVVDGGSTEKIALFRNRVRAGL